MPEIPSLSGAAVSNVFAEGGALSRVLDAYEAREGQREMDRVGELITRALQTPDDDAALGMVKVEVEKLCRMFPLYGV